MNVRRHILGVLSIVLLIAGFVLLIKYGLSSGQMTTVASACMRIGAVLGAIWLAFPQVKDLAERFPPWLMAVIGGAICLIAIAPKTLIFVGPLILIFGAVQFIGWMFKPPVKRRKRRTATNASDKDETLAK